MLAIILDIFILIFKSIFFFLLFLITLIMFLLVYGMFLFYKEDAKHARLKKLYTESQEKCVVKLISIGHEKIQVIRVLKESIDWDLSTAKAKVEAELPVIVSYDMPLKLAEELKINLERLDTIIEIHQF